MTGSDLSFKDFLFRNIWNRNVLIIALVAIILQFIIFKYYYPFAGFIFADSYVYLESAHNNYDINTYLVGYSKFLRLFSVFTSSDVALIAFQYFFIQASSLFFIYTLFYFYTPRKFTQYLLIGFMVFNPLFLYLANYVSSDSTFLALSLIWFSLLIWILYKPSMRIMLAQAVILVTALTFRYNALIYPLILTATIWLAKISFKQKFITLLTTFTLCGIFVGYNTIKYKKITGYWQFSPFSGWQIANNAMYAYRYVDSADRKPVPERFRIVDQMVREYFDSSRNILTHPFERDMASTVYMWNKDLTLYKYRDMLFQNDPFALEFKRWASMGPFYKDYGMQLIKQYPWHYIKYFLWPNANKFFATPVEFLENYNSGKDTILQIAQNWFGYKSLHVNTRTGTFKVKALNFYPILTGVANSLLIFSLICFGLMNGFEKRAPFRDGIILMAITCIINAIFGICSTAAALRFLSFPILLTVTLVCLLIDWLLLMGKYSTVDKKSTDTPIAAQYQSVQH